MKEIEDTPAEELTEAATESPVHGAESIESIEDAEDAEDAEVIAHSDDLPGCWVMYKAN